MQQSMSQVSAQRSDREPSIPHATANFLHHVHQGSDPTFFRRLEDRQFLAMNRAYAGSGGLASGDEIARRLRRRSEQSLSTIARWIVERRIVSLEWQSQTLIPLFQLDLTDMTLKNEVVEVVNELKPVFDGWELAVWFAEPNVWLDGESPVHAIELKPNDVLQAARADRFVALG